MPSEPTMASDLGLVYVPDWPDRARRALLGVDWSKPRLAALAMALGEGTQTMEDVTFDLLLTTRLEAASGVTLDVFGRIVGELRGPLADSDYRRFIQARILANVSKGSIDEVVAIWALVTGGQRVAYATMYPAGYSLLTVRPSWLSEPLRRRVRRIMDDVRPAGVTHELVEALVGYFGFDGDEALGFGDGTFARIL